MPHSIKFSYEFETHRLDVAQRVLTRNGQSIPLTPKATDVLLMLLHNAGQLVEKELLINQVWPDAFIEEANLTQNIFLLRRALQDDGSGPKFIETVARRGYRFVAPVKKVPAPTADADDEQFVSPRAAPILAALPFINGTGDDELQYLAEGIPESIINSFSSLSQLRVISRSTAFRYKKKQIDPQAIGQRLGADVLLMGKISGRESALSVSVELVRVDNGWQLWGQTFAVDSANIFEIQDEIKRQIARALNLPLTREDEKRVAKRYTENAAAYQAYLEGRYHWSRYTRTGIERAIDHFGRAIDLDPNYALAYAGIVDCYLRLATNYLPPEDGLPLLDDAEFDLVLNEPVSATDESLVGVSEQERVVQEKVKLRHEWDWKGAERELRRANELKTDYPAAHQWHAAYVFSRHLYDQSVSSGSGEKVCGSSEDLRAMSKMARQFSSIGLTDSERVQVLCTIAREQIMMGNYEAGKRILASWLHPVPPPQISDLSESSAADLLFTLGTLAGYVSSAGVSDRGQRQAESLLNGAIALFEHLGLSTRTAETRIELARCYYREGLFDMARSELERALTPLMSNQDELKSLCLVLFGVVDRDTGRLWDSVRELEAALDIEDTGQLVTGRCQHELATTLKELASAECDESYGIRAAHHFRRALHESEAIGNHRLAAASDNNLGYLLMMSGNTTEAEQHLLRARSRFQHFNDEIRSAQVNETLARLYTRTGDYKRALECISSAVFVLERTDEEALVSEALRTKGVVLRRLSLFHESKKAFADAYKVAERCRDHEGCAHAILLTLEETCEELDDEERQSLGSQLARLFAFTQQASLRKRCEKVLNHLSEVHKFEVGVLRPSH